WLWESLATNVPFSKVTFESLELALPPFRFAHAMPFEEVKISPPQPTATKRPWPKATDCSRSAVPENRLVHQRPSLEVRIVPPWPTATNRPFPKATARSRSSVSEFCAVQAVPS